ncbi:MAG: aminopeptidase, partial [Ahrensia sp.]|nr:aminopeptidase [Ahrensia sp.]
MPDNKSYKTYVDLGRNYVTVAVFAAPEFSTAPLSFCFPVFGCVPYQAHFSLEAARKQRTELQAKGFDVNLSGVTAYSTLGWTADPLLNTMFSDDETRLPSVVFHELAHQKSIS